MFTMISSIPTGKASARADAVLGIMKLSSPMKRGARRLLQRLHTKRREGQKMEVPRTSYGAWREVQRNFKTLDSMPGFCIKVIGVSLIMTHCLSFIPVFLHLSSPIHN